MPELTDLSYVRALCEKYDFALSKGFGQNFIVNPGLPPKIVDASGVDKRYGVIEIGPGIGVLTRELAKRAAKVVSKNAGFTGVRLGYTVVPKELKCGDVSLNAMWARRHGTKFNGAPYIQQRAGEAVYSEAGKAQLKEQVAYYMNNAKTILEGLKSAGYTVSGGVNAPYIWLKTPDKMTSWEFFDYLLEKANVVGTPGSGFGPSGEGYFRLTAFGSYENTVKALERIKAL